MRPAAARYPIQGPIPSVHQTRIWGRPVHPGKGKNRGHRPIRHHPEYRSHPMSPTTHRRSIPRPIRPLDQTSHRLLRPTDKLSQKLKARGITSPHHPKKEKVEGEKKSDHERTW